MAAETSGGQGNLKHASPIPPELRRFYRRKNFPVARLGESALPWYAEMTKATISSKGQIAIPKAVRQRLNLKAGTEISIDVQGEALVMRRLVRNFPDWRTMQGMVRGGESLAQALEAEHRAELDHHDARLQDS